MQYETIQITRKFKSDRFGVTVTPSDGQDRVRSEGTFHDGLGFVHWPIIKGTRKGFELLKQKMIARANKEIEELMAYRTQIENVVLPECFCKRKKPLAKPKALKYKR